MQLSLKNVSYSYNSKDEKNLKALSGINLCVKEGDYIGITGSTGSGKTTLIQLMAALLKPDEGSLLLDNVDVHEKNYPLSELRKKVGIVFQFPDYQLFEPTVEKDLIFGLKHLELSKEEKEKKAKDILESLNFNYEKFRHLSPLSLSGGEKKLIAIAGVLITKPSFLILDEALAGLDHSSSKSLLKILSVLNKEGTTIIMVSHNIDILSEHAKRLLIVEEGKIIMDAESKKVLNEFPLNSPKKIAKLLGEKIPSFNTDITSYDDLLKAVKELLA